MTDTPTTPSPGAPDGATGQPQPTGGAQFFDWVRSLGFVRGRDRWLAGVCGAIAARTGLDPLIVRGIAVVVAVLGGPILFLYAVGWALIPDQSGRSLVEQAVHQVFEPAMIAVGALLLLTFVPWMQGIWWQGPPLIWGMPGWLEVLLRTSWAIGLTVGIVVLVIYLAKRVPSPRNRAGGYPNGGYPNGGAPYGGPPSAGQTQPPGASTAAPTSAAATVLPPRAPVTEAPAASPHAAESRSLWDDLTGRDAQPSGQHGAAARGSAPHGSSIFDPHVYRELHRRKHLGAGFLAVVVGLALSAGAVAASVVADGAWSNSAFLVGAAAALAVIAVGIVVAGIRGKEGGWLNFFSIVLASTLAWTAFIPTGTDVVTFGAPTWEYDTRAPTGLAMIAGAPVIDLTAIDSTASSAHRTIDVWLGFGDTELILPENRTVAVQVANLAGGIDYDTVGDPSPDRGGVLFHDSRVVTEGAGTGVTTVRVWTGFGQVTINQPAAPALR